MSPKRAEMLLRRVLVGLFVVSLSGATLRADAQSCGFTLDKTPSRAVDPALWSGLEPTERINSNGTGLHPDRDTTEYNLNGAFSHSRPFWRSIDAAGGWVFGGYNLGLHLFDARSGKAAAPSLAASVKIESLPILHRDPHNFFVVNDVDAVDGDSNVVLMTGGDGIGLVALDTSNKSLPRLFYQDGGASGTKVGQGVYATKIGGRYYGFLAAQVGAGAGVWVYDLSAALGGTCVEERPGSVNCPGVFKTKLTDSPQGHVDGAGSDQIGHFVVFSGGYGGTTGLEIWNFSQPSAPVRALTGFTNRRVDGVALWEQAGKLYLAATLRADKTNPLDEARIYDVSCIRTGCGANPLSGSGLYDFPTPGPGLDSRATASHSVSDGQHYLHVGRANSFNIDLLQAEWLLNVTAPSNPFDLAGGDPRNGNLGQPTMTVGGKTAGYWSWYQACNPESGSNHFEPADGIVSDGYFYRAGSSILDVHEVMDASPTLLVSVTPETTYTGTGPGSAVSAQATALNCTPLAGQWAWTASGGGVVTGSSNNVTIEWPTVGSKTVSVSNPGCSGATVNPVVVTVLAAAPAVGSVTSDVASALVCSQVTFTANDVTGKPTLQHSWQILDGTNAVVANLSSTSQTAVWDTAGVAPGSYKARYTVSNSTSSATKDSGAVEIKQLDPLGFSAPIDATVDFGDVVFAANATGATEWKWDFGDGTSLLTKDPVLGPAPSHTYEAVGTYDVTVAIRNCEEGWQTSAVKQVEIVELNPLEITNFAASGQFALSPDAGDPVTFTTTVIGDPDFYDYDWHGDGTFEDSGNTAPVQSHTFNTPGSYQPVLRIRKGTAADQFQHLEVIVVSEAVKPPSVSLSGPMSGTIGQSRSFSASASNCSPGTWSWQAGGGAITGSGSTVSIVWATAGTKTVKVTASGCDGLSASRSITISSTDTVPLGAAFTIAPAAPKVGEAVSFDASGSTGNPVDYIWDFGDGSTGTGKQTTHTYTQGGARTVRLEVSRDDPSCQFGVCTDVETKTVTIGPGTSPGELAASFTSTPAAPKVGEAVSFDASASTGNPVDYIWDFGDGSTGSGKQTTHTYTQPGVRTVTLEVSKDDPSCQFGVCADQVTKTVTVESGVSANGCTGSLADDVDKLCLGEGRYVIEVDWDNHHSPQPEVGEGRVRRLGGSESTGFFWFFNQDSIDLIVKIIDGTIVNEHVWVFYGALTDVIYDLKVTDTLTDQTKSYKNLAGSICGRGDTTAFSTAGLTAPATAPSTTAADLASLAAEAGTEEVLHLLDGRFKVTVDWENHHANPRQTGAGSSVPGTDGSGYFWFFEPSSLDLVVKMIDAREFDGHFWVFYGGLSDVKYTLQIEDLVTGQSWERVNPAGSICGGSDTAAFTALGN